MFDDVIEEQFDLRVQEAKAADRKPERPRYEGEDSAEQAAARAELAGKELFDELKKEAQAEKAAAQNVGIGGEVPTVGALAEVPEVPGKVDQEPELAMPKTEPLTKEHVSIGDVVEWEGLKLKVTGFDDDGVAMTEQMPCCDNPEPHGHEGSGG